MTEALFPIQICLMTGWFFSPCNLSLPLSSISLFYFPPPTPSALDFMNLLNWRWWGACGTLSYWFAVGFSVVGNTSQSLGWTHEAFYLESPSTGKPAFSMDFFIMSLWKANAFAVWRALPSLRSARPLTTFVIPWKPYCTAPCPDNSLDKGPRPGVSQLKLYFATSKNVTAG